MQSGNSVNFVFEYADGPFHNTFTWNPESKGCHLLLEQKNAEDKWSVFADRTAMRNK